MQCGAMEGSDSLHNSQRDHHRRRSGDVQRNLDSPLPPLCLQRIGMIPSPHHPTPPHPQCSPSLNPQKRNLYFFLKSLRKGKLWFLHFPKTSKEGKKTFEEKTKKLKKMEKQRLIKKLWLNLFYGLFFPNFIGFFSSCYFQKEKYWI